MSILKKICLTVFCLIGLAVAIWKAPNIYSRWRANRALDMARNFAEKGDAGNVMLSIQASIRARPNNPDAYRFLAELMEADRNPEAVQCRKIVVKFLPESASEKFALVKTALQFNQIDTAGKTLAAIPPDARNCPEYLEFEVFYYCAKREVAAAVRACEALEQKFPGFPKKKFIRLAVAKLQIESDNPEDRAKAIATLKKMADDPDLGTRALRIAISGLMKAGEYHAALQMNGRLMSLPKPTEADRLQNLDLLFLCHSPLAEKALPQLKAEAKDNPETAARLARCLLERRGSQEALEWLETLPAAIKKRMPVPVVLADCYISIKDWKSLEPLVASGNWERMEAQRLALLSRVYRERNEEAMASDIWGQARAAARNQTASQLFLYHMEMEDGHPGEAHEILWDIPLGDPMHDWAQKELFAYYRQQNDANDLLKLLDRITKDHPDDLSVKLDIAQLLLVLDKNPGFATKLASEVYLADPKPVSHAAVYAYSLCVNGEPAKAAAILDSRNKSEIAENQCMVYYGLILAACKRNAEAQECFKNMDPDILFPEMKAKVDRWQEQWKKETGTAEIPPS
ncbi:MAG: hypothetical protein PHD76_12930 [Methylacidiphilales bacterium]|nr:hypothetical protein [Candidatus Methylacidiphilales bacterium]